MLYDLVLRHIITKLYKFIANPSALHHILKGALKFAPIAELNDPSELSPAVVAEDVRASLKKLRRTGYSDEDMTNLQRQGHILRRLVPQFQRSAVPRSAHEATEQIRSSVYNSMVELEHFLVNLAHEISSKVGLFCTSYTWDSLPMWAHYAANATGLVVEFQNLEGIFTGDETGVLNKLIEVRYQRESSGMTFDPKSHESLFFDKFKDWSYEREIRVVLPLDECRREIVDSRTTYLYDINPGCVSRLILGWRVQREKAEFIRAIAREASTPVPVVQTSIHRGSIQIGNYGSSPNSED